MVSNIDRISAVEECLGTLEQNVRKIDASYNGIVKMIVRNKRDCDVKLKELRDRVRRLEDAIAPVDDEGEWSEDVDEAPRERWTVVDATGRALSRASFSFCSPKSPSAVAFSAEAYANEFLAYLESAGMTGLSVMRVLP